MFTKSVIASTTLILSAQAGYETPEKTPEKAPTKSACTGEYNRRLGYTNEPTSGGEVIEPTSEPTSAPTSADLTGDAYTTGETGGEVIEPTSEPTSAPTDDPCDLSDSDVAGTPDSDTPETDITDTFLLTPGDAASEESEESSASTLSACAMTMTAVVVSLFL